MTSYLRFILSSPRYWGPILLSLIAIALAITALVTT